MTRHQNVSITALDGTQLNATLDVPDGHPVGALVVLHGAEMPERDFFLYEHLGSQLPQRGWAVLRYDRRPSKGTLPLAQQRQDALAAIKDLRNRLPVDVPIGLWGFSQGAWTAIETAADEDAVDLVVLVGCSAVSPAVQMRYATANFLREEGYDETAVKQLMATRDAADGYLLGHRSRQEAQAVVDKARRKPWFDLAYLPEQLPIADELRQAADFMFFDPTSRLVQVDAPILVLYGDRDDHIPVHDCIAALRDLHKQQLTVEVFEGVGHFLTHDDDREARRLHHEYVSRLVNWLRTAPSGGVS